MAEVELSHPDEVQRIHELVDEYRQVLFSPEVALPVQTNAVVVLSHSYEDSIENQARTNLGIELVKKITAERLGKTVEELSDDDLRQGPVLMINGLPDQNQAMAERAMAQGLPDDTLAFVPNPAEGANTKTQFELIPPEFLEPGKHLTIISSDYHGPRVVRYADKLLPQEVKFDFYGLPYPDAYKDFQTLSKTVKGEVKRIIKYSNQGDLSARPRNQNTE